MPVFELSVHNATIEKDGNNTIITNISLEEVNSLLKEVIAYESMSVLSSECTCGLDTTEVVEISFFDEMSESILLSTDPEKTGFKISYEGGSDE